MVLVDTSVWIDHLRSPNLQLMDLLLVGQVLGHPAVLGELSCGNLKDRRNFLLSLSELPQATPASNAEVLNFIEARKLYGRGLGWVDAHLLASARLSGCRLLTLDLRLQQAAMDLAVGLRNTGVH